MGGVACMRVRRVANARPRRGPGIRSMRSDCANICEQCDNFVTATEFVPALQAQLADISALRDLTLLALPIVSLALVSIALL
jgi:hypothetical protein